MFSLRGKKAVVTGGGSGIGKAVSLAFAKKGAWVNIIDVNREQGQEIADLIIKNGGKAFIHRCDVSNQKEVSDVFKSVGKMDLLINSAGIAHVGKAHDTSEPDFDRVFAVNVKGIYNCLHEAIPAMKSNGGGVILNICSIAAHSGLPDRFAYS